MGARDSIADFVAAAVCLDDLGVTSIFVSPVHLGSGFVTCQHGRLPVPAPATALLLSGFPAWSDPAIAGELTTPTGAALLKGLGAVPGFPPGFTWHRVGHGGGRLELPIPNLLRAFLGGTARHGRRLDAVTVLETNLDNVTGELLGHVLDRLMAAGALDVSLTPTQMKKGRPGHLLAVMARPAQADALEDLLFAELPTLGIRRHTMTRAILDRTAVTVDTAFGPLAGKAVTTPDGSARTTVEFEARRQAAAAAGLPLRVVDERLAAAVPPRAGSPAANDKRAPRPAPRKRKEKRHAARQKR